MSRSVEVSVPFKVLRFDLLSGTPPRGWFYLACTYPEFRFRSCHVPSLEVGSRFLSSRVGVLNGFRFILKLDHGPCLMVRPESLALIGFQVLLHEGGFKQNIVSGF